MGIENLNTTVAVGPIFICAVLGFFSYTAEQIMDANSAICDAYYSLNWFEAPTASRKLILLAMQPPMDAKFCGLFSYDHASLIRFTSVLRNAYDFGLVVVKLAQK